MIFNQSYSSKFSKAYVKLKGLNAFPSALKNLLANSTQCRRRECKKHSIKSMAINTPKVTLAKMKNPI